MHYELAIRHKLLFTMLLNVTQERPTRVEQLNYLGQPSEPPRWVAVELTLSTIRLDVILP